MKKVSHFSFITFIIDGYVDAGENTENNAFAEPENTFEGSSPAWLAEPDAEEDVSDGGHAQDSTHSFDEYFVADLPSELATSYTYDPSEPEMREISGNTLSMCQSFGSGSSSYY